ncbi:MAG: hemerythrin family protein [Desulfamplus sp.]|nr:hemerythrin family protein [Desulfamplus sp.]
MTKIIWSESFSVGYEDIDNQHKQWIEIFNEAYDKMMGNDYSALSDIGTDALKKMREYARMHFGFEEKYMEQINYPDLAQHKLLHEMLLLQLDRINKEFEEGVPRLNSEIIKVIENWLVGHIRHEDQKYNTFRKNSRS